MRKTVRFMFCAGIGLGIGLLYAQGRQRASPHEQVSATIGGKKVTIDYGRPYKKGREIFGGLVPWDQVWRTGADEATVLTTEGDLMVGSVHVPAGSYSLFTIPSKSGWTLVVNKTAKQWGAFKYDEKTDLGRTKMQVETLSSPVEQFTIAIEPKGGNQGVIRMTWDTTAAQVPVMAH